MTAPGWISVYRSDDTSAEQDATAVRNRLRKAGLQAELAGGAEAGLADDVFEVRVPDEEAESAIELVGSLSQDDEGEVDPSHDLDMVTLLRTDGTTGEMEAMAVQSILDANGISAMLVGAASMPNLSFEVRVARGDLARAGEVIAEAKAAGPAAAAEAERQSEPPV